MQTIAEVLAAAQAAGAVRLPVTELVTERYRALREQVPDADHAAALLALEELNPNVRLGAQADQLP